MTSTVRTYITSETGPKAQSEMPRSCVGRRSTMSYVLRVFAGGLLRPDTFACRARIRHMGRGTGLERLLRCLGRREAVRSLPSRERGRADPVE